MLKSLKMPVYWASYLINGDSSGLEPGEKERADTYLKRNGIVEVLDVESEPHFSWSYDLHGGNCFFLGQHIQKKTNFSLRSYL